MVFYTKAAAGGDVHAMWNLLALLDRGHGVPRDVAAALHWYNEIHRRAEQGDSEAQYWTAMANYLGVGGPDERDATMDKNLTGNSPTPNNVELGDNADVPVGQRLYLQLTLAQDEETDTEILLPPVKGLRLGGQKVMQEAAFNSDGWLKTHRKIVVEVTPLHSGRIVIPHFDVDFGAGKVHHVAETILTVVAQDGGESSKSRDASNDPAAGGTDFVKRDISQAVVWFKAAADRGNADAQFDLGLLYQAGKGVTQSDATAMQWFRLAADKDNPEAQDALGHLFETGRSIGQDLAQAAVWYAKAAAQRNPDAEANLGSYYLTGKGVTQDYRLALSWSQKAAEDGNIGAEANLGQMNENGWGIPQDFASATSWYTKAAAGGSVFAKNRLQFLSFTGAGVVYQTGLSHEMTKESWRANVPPDDLPGRQVGVSTPVGILMPICSKSTLFQKVGIPDHTRTVDGIEYLDWQCYDGQIELVCQASPYRDEGQVIGLVNDY